MGQTPLRHGLGFLISGGIAFGTDAAILKLLTAWLGIHPIAARLVAITAAIVAGWLAHRRLTFALTVAPSLAELMRYAAVAWSAAAFNYALFVLIVLVRPAIDPLAALVAASAGAMAVSYLGMRFGAFRERPTTPGK